MANVPGQTNAAPAVTESISESSQLYGKPASQIGPLDAIKVDGNKSLTLVAENLILKDPTATKAHRTCGFAGFGASATSATHTIPLYNVLWAEQTNESLVIDYAKQVAKNRVQAAKLTFAINEADGADVQSWVDTLLTKAYGPAKRCKRAKVLVNPHAGPGGAEKKWRVDCEPLFKAARMPMDVELTTYSGQALKTAREVDIDAFDTIVTCSGDGLAHEVFNGLAQRPDAARALRKIAVSHIPCGSGNAMSINLYGSHRASIAALALIKGVETPMDLISITQGDRRTLSFLSQSLGIVAESDLGTEHLRWMGGARFTWGYLMRIFEKKCYPCDLAVKVEIEDKPGVKEHYRQYTHKASSTSLGTAEAPRAENADAAQNQDAEPQGLPPLKYGTINEDLPDGWELIPHDKMGNFYCGNMPFMAADANFFSAALPNDGLMDLVCINGDVSVSNQLSLILGVDSGKLFDNPLVSYRKISAYRIIPRNQKNGYISIDGEKVPFEPFQAEVHPGLGRVISKRGKYEGPGPAGWEKSRIGA
ncbi:diacylglycerol kinase catalytic domain-containing protein [Colletotrichum graminicola]|uniref:Diacylglycerol kinase catalytic domain-containing protein n=1 Tax=Colletotrichum graminicola (strain M1.001 / M2 / FGSC 10212) TaxID=645133 RepID=E3QXU6_COLGM|nr:diacylglycerol kinase catalytic domain-containing protein [Colletotrichum graminicola M1.001]EFQ35684.1 diacylglycerol kinase catalytic domain-containing protein [Colletotrichum graminicola M1.001]WDK14775.1 diacylglycerol kinase catalytic domain-containing protein [Colletotrichum graminicola]